jgi:hypothetical protein
MPSPRSAWAAVALALLAGCEHGDMRTPIAIHPIAPLPALTPAQTRGLVSVPWTLQESAPTGDTLLLGVSVAVCPRLSGAVVTETPTTVTVQIFAPLTPCTEFAGGVVTAPVHLAGPLGDRHLRHGPVMPAGAIISTAPPVRQGRLTRSPAAD